MLANVTTSKLRLERGQSRTVPPPDDPDLPESAEKSSLEAERPAPRGAKERCPKTYKSADPED